jgi:hypothetical protein
MGKRTMGGIHLSFHALGDLFHKKAATRCDRIGNNRVAHYPPDCRLRLNRQEFATPWLAFILFALSATTPDWSALKT